jgi:integrase
MDTLRTLLIDHYAPLHYLTDRSIVLYLSTLDRYRDFLGHEPTLDDLTDLQAVRFVKWRSATPHGLKRPVRPASVAKDVTQLRALWTWAAKKRMTRSDGQLIEFPDFKRPHVPKPVAKAYTVEEVSALLRQARTRKGMVGRVPACWFWMTLPRAQWEVGGRIGELMALRWNEVDLERCRLTFLAETRKGKRETLVVQISKELAGWMATQRGTPGDLVWPWFEGRKELSLYNSLRVLCRTAGVRYLPFHSFRKSTASYIKKAGGSAKGQLGHASEEMAEDHYYSQDILEGESALDYLPPLDLDGPSGGPGKPR